MYFPSIRDKWITGVVWSVSLLGILFPLLKGQVVTTLIMLGLSGFLLWFWFRTGYKIEENKIKIYYGPIRQTVHIPEIKLIMISKMPINSPALSFKRIQISCGKYDVVAVSPQDREKFISTLLDIRPEIPIDEQLLPRKTR
ncbi:PH domain-containing protein [Oceanobacillus alkalisoli]|uniref:PH domain-containing protein n=1 Tax=Oceanobacillus alkalisoli TaxID=2925113 RepID=UPI001F11EB71|nr:PH domain-containing protein [Oceanobacillus alkalisoli]MCF3942322.1 PH domain-containing protein [Oceanobacillus alkalisoli]